MPSTTPSDGSSGAPPAQSAAPEPSKKTITSTDIPWTLIDSSVDLMDTTFCNKKYPPPFRSSVAVYAFEPNPDLLPEEIACSQHLLFLKISCSITGYQPSGEENGQIVKLLSGVPEIDPAQLEQLTRDYLACYGVLLNVAVFPFDNARRDDIDSYPRIIDFEPKLREMLQAASETGEVLTTSANKVNTDTSFSTTEVVKDSWKVTTDIGLSEKVTGGAKIGMKGELGREQTDTNKSDLSVKSEALMDQKEKHAITTTLSQLYNLLTGYHAGTNRATFLMLPRPHVLQPTDQRSFIQGLRAIEGIQDFFLVVSRLKSDDRIKLDIHLQTGHFPEGVESVPTIPEAELFETRSEVIGPISEACPGPMFPMFGGSSVTDVTNGPRVLDGFEADGWEFDTREGDTGHRAISEERLPDDTLTMSPTSRNSFQFLKRIYQREAPDKVRIHIVVESGFDALFSRRYRVHLRRRRPVVSANQTDPSRLLITQRSLCTQIQLGGCLRKIPFTRQLPSLGDLVIVDEPLFPGPLPLPWDPAGVGASAIAAEQRDASIEKLRKAMLSSQSSPRRYELGRVGYLESQAFARRLLQVLPERVLESRITLPTHSGDALTTPEITLKEALRMDLGSLSDRIALSPEDAAHLRSGLLANVQYRRPEPGDAPI